MTNTEKIVRDAIASNSKLAFSYTDSKGVLTNRVVVPEETQRGKAGQVIVVAVDSAKNEYRKFSITGMGNVTIAN